MEDTVTGGCHCGAVRFSAKVSPDFEVVECNCSICDKKGLLHLIVPKASFTLLSGEEKLSTYTFQTHVAKHHFCSICGICSFYVPRSNPDGIDINARCLDGWATMKSRHKIVPFDGQNWEDNATSLAHLSQ